MQHTAAHTGEFTTGERTKVSPRLQRHCSTLQLTATHRNTLQHTLQYAATHTGEISGVP